MPEVISVGNQGSLKNMVSGLMCQLLLKSDRLFVENSVTKVSKFKMLDATTNQSPK